MHAYCKHNSIGIIPGWVPLASEVLARPIGTDSYGCEK
jgi:hypothetical protein